MAEVKGSRMPTPEDYPSNSKTPRKEEKKEHVRIEAVVKGGVSEKKTSGQKIFRLFFSEDMQDVKKYVLEDLIVPGIKYGILDTLGRIFFNQPGGYRPQSYTNYSRSSSQTSTRTTYTPPTQKARATYFADDGSSGNVLRTIIFTSRHDAERVLQILDEQIRTYDEATVMQYYDACGLSSQFTDDSWGWLSLLGVRAISVRGGYMLNLPDPTYLE